MIFNNIELIYKKNGLNEVNEVRNSPYNRTVMIRDNKLSRLIIDKIINGLL